MANILASLDGQFSKQVDHVCKGVWTIFMAAKDPRIAALLYNHYQAIEV